MFFFVSFFFGGGGRFTKALMDFKLIIKQIKTIYPKLIDLFICVEHVSNRNKNEFSFFQEEYGQGGSSVNT